MSRPLMALTFDDGPSYETLAFVDLFERLGVQATFFVVGQRIGGHEGVVGRATDVGCEIANHTYTHRLLSRLSDEEAEEEMQRCSKAIEAVTGSAPSLMRPPAGDLGPATLGIATKLGLTTALWSILGMDFDGRCPPDVIGGALIEGAHPGGVAILHDSVFDASLVEAANRQKTLRALETAIPALLDAGYELVTLSRLLAADRAAREEIVATSPEMARALLPQSSLGR